jgi:hypothetical protein
MPREQAGFRKVGGTRDQITKFRWIMEWAKECHKNVYLCFIDYAKAFDNVGHLKMWNSMRSMGISKHLIGLIGDMYTVSSGQTRHSRMVPNKKRSNIRLYFIFWPLQAIQQG